MMKRFSFRNLSIQQRLPLLICILLLTLIISFSWISYISVKDEAITAGKERLSSLSDQLSAMLTQSATNLLTATKAAANEAPIIQTLATNDTTGSGEAMQVLKRLRNDTTWILAELVNNKKEPVLRSVRDSAQSFEQLDSLLALSMDYDPEGVGKIYLLNNKMFYAVSVPVQADKRQVGHLVRWQKVSTNPRTLEQLSKLMGLQAKIYLGNEDGSLWTDMMKPVAYRQQSANQVHQLIESTNQENQPIFAMVKPVRNTHWLVSVEIQQKLVLETASHFLRRIIIIGTILLLAGILIAWLMSRNITKPLKKLTAATATMASGDYSATVPVDRRDELGKLARTFNAMIGQVSKAQHGLEQKIIESAEMNEQLRDLSAYLQNVREDERIHIAREMHDELGQVLTGFKMDVSWLRKKLADSKDPLVMEKLDYMLKVIDESVKFVRKLASELRPSILDDLGLIPALEWHSQEFEKRYNIKTAFHSDTQDLHVSSLVATGLFRMYQESLTNVARHSNATHLDVMLRVVNDELSLSITDNGKGFDTSNANKKTLGLLGMKERAAMIGGHLDIRSEAGKGTTIHITVKHSVAEQATIS
jgi:signal transduction histidine kinase